MKLIAALVLAVACCMPAIAAADDSLYQDLGGRDGIQALTVDFVARVKADARIGHFFKDINARHLSSQLRDQFCELSGGPCKLDAPTMRDAHDGLGVGKSDFNALVDVLQQAMDAQRIPFATQNRLLALLAPLHRDVIGH